MLAPTGTIGLLTSIPVLCFGLAAPLASLLIARSGVPHAPNPSGSPYMSRRRRLHTSRRCSAST